MPKIIRQIGATCGYYALANAIVQTQHLPKRMVHDLVQATIHQQRPHQPYPTRIEQATYTHVGELFTHTQMETMLKAMCQQLSKPMTIQSEPIPKTFDALQSIIQTMDDRSIYLWPIRLTYRIKGQLFENIHWLACYQQNQRIYVINPNWRRTQRLTSKKSQALIHQIQQAPNVTFYWWPWYQQIIRQTNTQYRYRFHFTKWFSTSYYRRKQYQQLLNETYSKQFFKQLSTDSQETFRDLHYYRIQY